MAQARRFAAGGRTKLSALLVVLELNEVAGANLLLELVDVFAHALQLVQDDSRRRHGGAARSAKAAGVDSSQKQGFSLGEALHEVVELDERDVAVRVVGLGVEDVGVVIILRNRLCEVVVQHARVRVQHLTLEDSDQRKNREVDDPHHRLVQRDVLRFGEDDLPRRNEEDFNNVKGRDIDIVVRSPD